jgi:hypothetical protein
LKEGFFLITKKKIHIEIASSLLEEMKNALEGADVVSLGKFIARNFNSLNALLHSGKNIKQIYEYLKAKGQDVGTYHSFRTLCYRAGLRRREPKVSPIQGKPLENTKTQELIGAKKLQEPTKSKNVSREEEPKTKESKYNPRLPPIFLPGGVEAIIDPETGAKRFEI